MEKVSFTVKIDPEIRKEFFIILAKKEKRAREILPVILQQWINKNKKK